MSVWVQIALGAAVYLATVSSLRPGDLVVALAVGSGLSLLTRLQRRREDDAPGLGSFLRVASGASLHLVPGLWRVLRAPARPGPAQSGFRRLPARGATKAWRAAVSTSISPDQYFVAREGEDAIVIHSIRREESS